MTISRAGAPSAPDAAGALASVPASLIVPAAILILGLLAAVIIVVVRRYGRRTRRARGARRGTRAHRRSHVGTERPERAPADDPPAPPRVSEILLPGEVIPREQAEASLREETRLYETLQHVGSLVTAELDTERLVQLVTDEATVLTGAAMGAFMYHGATPGKESVMLYALSGVPRERFGSYPLPRNTPVFGPTLRGEASVRSDDITRDPRYGHLPPYHGMPPGHPPVRSYLAVPVVSRTGVPLGGLFFGHPEPGVFTERHEREVAGIAAWAAVAMDNARLYEQERALRAEAQAANRAKSEFLATMSHELRTPLNAIAGYAELLAMGVRGPVTPQQLEDLARIQRSQRHLLSLINDVLNFAKVEAGHLSLDVRDVPLRGLLSGLEVLVAPQMRARSLRYACEESDADTVVRADAEKVQQILLNLLSNAIKFTPAGGAITVHTEARNGTVAIHVRDTGRGVPRDKLERIFEPFVQLDRDFASAHEGTGLGLAISRDLARAMNGDLTVASEEGRGATFTLLLPVASGG